MSFWSKLLTVGGKTLGAAKTGAKASAKSIGNSVIHPSQTLNHAGKAVKTATVGGAVGYVGWEKLTTDKSVTRIVSDAVIGEEATDAIAGTASDVKELKDKAGEAVDSMNNAMGDINSKWSGMSKFFRNIFNGNGLDMFGSFFSFPLQNIFPRWNPLIPDPSQYPMVMMAISLMFGVVHITAGVACRMAVKIKHKQALSAWFVDFPWVIVFVAFILAILNPALDMVGYEPYLALKLPDAASTISLYVCLGALAVAIIFAGLDSKGILGKAMASFNAAYGLINYFSDIMSYIRVFGLMLSSALMGQVINQLAGMVLGGGGVGYVFAVLLLIFAHMFNLVMGILGVYIHDGRLQYVEFFAQFCVTGKCLVFFILLISTDGQNDFVRGTKIFVRIIL